MDAIHKIITWVLSPMGILFLGLAFGGLLRAFGTNAPTIRKIGAWVIALVLVVFWVLGCGITTRFIGAPLEGPEIDVCSMATNELSKVDAIVLLGGGMGHHEKCQCAEILGGADRVWLAARLWKKLHVPMTVSGSGAPAELLLLSDMGVETNNVIVLDQAKNTEDEARMIADGIRSRSKVEVEKTSAVNLNLQPQPRILLVTSAWHMPRAAMLFARAGFDVVPAPTDYEMTYAKEAEIKFLDFFPTLDAMSRNAAALKEWVARACYWLKK